MPRVLFTSDPGPLEAPVGRFRAGEIYDLPEASAARWKLRGRVVDAPAEPAKSARRAGKEPAAQESPLLAAAGSGNGTGATGADTQRDAGDEESSGASDATGPATDATGAAGAE